MDVNKYHDFAEWAAECRRRGLTDGPHKLASRPLNSYQYVDKDGTAAMWNGEHNLGSIFRPSGNST